MEQKLIDELSAFFMHLGCVNGALTNESMLPYILAIVKEEKPMQYHLRTARDNIDKLLAHVETNLSQQKH